MQNTNSRTWKLSFLLKCHIAMLINISKHAEFLSQNISQDAGDFFKLGGQLEKSVSCYISIRNFTKAFPLLERLSSPKYSVEVVKLFRT